MKPLFHHENRQKSERSRRVYARYELAHTAADFIAAISFLIGSVMFFFESMQTPAIWLFVIGSVFFLIKPSLRLARELTLYRMGEINKLADREEQED
ncbi:YrhK family protein [Brevirhabdus sp.]|uniref:YrhK family protein n=1 Tax=Brevirhabdus sp. TaxID=2004514 RepID=UPI00405A303E